MLTANDQTAFSQLWNYRDAMSLVQQGRGNLMRRGHVLQDFGCGIDFFCGVRCPDQHAGDRHTYEQN
jgi:hypothetical protein